MLMFPSNRLRSARKDNVSFAKGDLFCNNGVVMWSWDHAQAEAPHRWTDTSCNHLSPAVDQTTSLCLLHRHKMHGESRVHHRSTMEVVFKQASKIGHVV